MFEVLFGTDFFSKSGREVSQSAPLFLIQRLVEYPRKDDSEVNRSFQNDGKVPETRRSRTGLRNLG